jgi:hypothetical protein
MLNSEDPKDNVVTYGKLRTQSIVREPQVVDVNYVKEDEKLDTSLDSLAASRLIGDYRYALRWYLGNTSDGTGVLYLFRNELLVGHKFGVEHQVVFDFARGLMTKEMVEATIK